MTIQRRIAELERKLRESRLEDACSKCGFPQTASVRSVFLSTELAGLCAGCYRQLTAEGAPIAGTTIKVLVLEDPKVTGPANPS